MHTTNSNKCRSVSATFLNSALDYLINFDESEPLLANSKDPKLGDNHVHAALASQGQGAVLQDLVCSALGVYVKSYMSKSATFGDFKPWPRIFVFL